MDPIRSRFGKIEKEEVSLSDRITDIREYVKGKKNVSFKSILSGRHSIRYVIVSFLAILELMKTGELYASQEKLFDDIIISYKDSEGV